MTEPESQSVPWFRDGVSKLPKSEVLRRKKLRNQRDYDRRVLRAQWPHLVWEPKPDEPDDLDESPPSFTSSRW